MTTRPAANRLLEALPGDDRPRWRAVCEPVWLAPGEVLATPGEPVRHVYFPTGGVVSLVLPTGGGAGMEVGLVGDEGMLGATLLLGVEAAPFHAVVQGPGPALRVAAAAFRGGLEASPALRRAVRRYLYVTVSQLAQSAVCNRFHRVEERLARWLLLAQDRARCDTFHATHVFLACMLGVRRVGVTKAAASLQSQNLIRYRRGEVTVVDRAGLEAAACGCYRAGKEVYERVLGRA